MGWPILECLPRLHLDNVNERLNGGCKLIQHLSREVQENGESKEYNCVFDRLIRCLSSSKVSSRKGFYSTLTVYLTMNPDVKFEKLFDIMDKELKTSARNSKSEFADINHGRILACGAIIRSKRIKTCSVDEQKKVLECLIHSGKQRNYLSFESVSFIIEFLNLFEDDESFKPLWPILEQEICKPYKEQTLDTFYALLVIQDRFPRVLTKKIIKKTFGNDNIINEESIKDIFKILTDIPRINNCKHPIYKLFCEKLVVTEYLEQFWNCIDECFVKPSITVQYLGVELFNLLLEVVTNKSIIPTLLSPNFLKYMLKRFSFNPKHKSDEVTVGFRKALTQLVTVLKQDVKAKLHIAVIKKLILYPGDLMIEKITGTKVLQMLTNNLSADGVKKLSNLYREIAANTKFKEKPDSEPQPWTNNERTYVIQMLSFKLMSHPQMASDDEWRIEQLKFLFSLGLCEVSNAGAELAVLAKESFYRALDHKLPKLDDLRTVLSTLIVYIDESIFKDSSLTLRTPLNATATEAWKKMMKHIKKLEKDSDTNKISVVFHVLNLHMGLQLFSDSEMAISTINELHSCHEHLKAKMKTQKKNNSIVSDDEPEWVEVVVDLLLSLLSRQSHLLRSLVGCVFPHICPHLTPSAIHQILTILDVKSGKNPLSTSKDGDESDSEDEFAEEENEEEDEENSDEENAEDIEEESDSEVESSDIEEDETVTDRLRLAVREALGDATMQTDDEDIDVDNINEEEGKRLDESLAAAFKILKENRKNQSKKQEKRAQALSHFRIRVIDLLESYLETSPSMALALDMLLPLFMLLEYAIKEPHQKALECKVKACLKKLAGVKKFKNAEDVDEELLTTILKALIEKGERSASICQEMGNKLVECCVFLVKCSQQTNISTDAFIQIFGENLTNFFRKRDCILPAILFKNLLQTCWVGNWHLAPLLVNFAFDETIKPFRRGHALEFLQVFYKYTRINTSSDHKDKRLKMEKELYKSSINVLEQSATQEMKMKQIYMYNLFTLLLTVHAHHIPEAWDWKKVGESMVKYRSTVTLAVDAKSAYNKLAARIGAPSLNQKKQGVEKTKASNGNEETKSNEDSTDNENEAITNGDSETPDKKLKNEKKRKKNSSMKKEKQKLKKEARELRAKAMSEGLESFDFSSVSLSNGVKEESMQNGDSEEKSPEKVKKAKRPNANTPDVPSKKKKKAVQSGD